MSMVTLALFTWEERSVKRKTLSLVMGFPRAQRAEKVEFELWGRSDREADISQYEGEINIP